MRTLNDYMDDLKGKCGSDYKAAKRLGVTNVTVCKIRSRQQLSDELALKIAHILDIDPSEILLAATIARSNGEVKEAWEKISKRSGIAAGLMIPLSLALSASHEFLNGTGMYIMLNSIL